MTTDHFPYIYEDGHWITIYDYQPSRFWKIAKLFAGALAISALLWFGIVVFFLI